MINLNKPVIGRENNIMTLFVSDEYMLALAKAAAKAQESNMGNMFGIPVVVLPVLEMAGISWMLATPDGRVLCIQRADKPKGEKP